MANVAAKAIANRDAGNIEALFDRDDLPIVDYVSDFSARPRPKEWLFDGFLAKGEISCLFGEPGAGKGAFAIDLACRVAGGLDWFGRTDGTTPFPDGGRTRRPVLYAALERPEQVRRRIEAFVAAHPELFEPATMPLAVWNGPLGLVDGYFDQLLEPVATMWQRNEDEPVLVIVDTLARAIDRGSDSGADETAAIVRHLEHVLRRCGAHIMIVAHSPLGDDTRPRGHGNLLAAYDTTIRVRRRGVVVTAEVLKDNDVPEDKKASFRYELRSELLGVDRHGREITAPVVVPLGTADLTGAAAEGLPVSRRRLTVGQQEVLEALTKAIEVGNGAAVPEVTWRQTHEASATDGTAATKRMRFLRAKSALIDRGTVVLADGLFSPANDN